MWCRRASIRLPIGSRHLKWPRSTTPRLVVDVGGLQPSLDAAASGARNRLDLKAGLATSDPYVWLDPDLMTRAVAVTAAALEAANPPAGRAYQAGARAFADAVASTGIDYESTLSACPRRTFATADGAFLGLAREYGLTDQVVGSEARPDRRRGLRGGRPSDRGRDYDPVL